MRHVLFALLLSSLCIGCGGKLKLHQVMAAVEKPGKITLLLDVTAPDGPVADLQAGNFAVFEDKRKLDGPAEVVISNPDLREHTRTILLLDMGGQPNETEIIQIGEAASAFLQGLPPQSKVTIYAFDGSPNPFLLLPQTSPRAGDAAAEARNLDKVRQFVPRDPSRDLNGAYKEAIAALDAQMKTSPVAVGALVLVVRGPDLAGRVKRSEVRELIDFGGDRDFARVVVAVGEEGQKAPVWTFSSWEPIAIPSLDRLKDSLGAVAERIGALGKSYYVISACSLGRAGPHTLRVEATRTATAPGGGEVEQSGRLEYSYDATGFGPGCDPSVPKQWGGSSDGASDPDEDGASEEPSGEEPETATPPAP